MARRILLVLPVLLVLIGTARAGRLGGAYREPYVVTEGLGAGGKRVVIDLRQFWMFRFEHQKESILADRIAALRTRAARPDRDAVRKDVLPLLLESLRHESSWIRDAAVLALGKLGDRTALPHLVDVSREDPDREVAEDALLALGLLRDAEAIPHLVATLEGKDRRRAAFAALALGLTADPAAKAPLLEACRSALGEDPPDETLASCIAVALGVVATERDVRVLAAPLPAKGLETVKVHACQALGRIGGKTARDRLVAGASAGRGNGATAAVLALGRLPEEPPRELLLGPHGAKSGVNLTKSAALLSLARIAARPERLQ